MRIGPLIRRFGYVGVNIATEMTFRVCMTVYPFLIARILNNSQISLCCHFYVVIHLNMFLSSSKFKSIIFYCKNEK